MSVLAKAVGKSMLKNLDTYNVYYDQVSKCVDKEKPVMAKSHPKIRENLEEAFLNLSTSWMAYKREVDLVDEEFNKVDETTGDAVFVHNDSWYEAMQEKYFQLCEKSDDVLEARDKTASGLEENKEDEKVLKNNNKDYKSKKVELILSQIEAETEELKIAINNLEEEVSSIAMGEIKSTKAMSFKSVVKDLSERLNVGLENKVMECLPMMEDAAEATNKNTFYIQFMKNQRTKIRKILEKVEEKAEVKEGSKGAVHTEKVRAEQTYLKKTDPPKFDGDLVKFPD